MELPWLAPAEFYCPVAGRSVAVWFLTYDGGRPVGVLSCSAFADPAAIGCGTPCVSDSARHLTAGAMDVAPVPAAGASR
jgi:hypothetical protein